jgi:ABC-type multidrug transport system fused ATPase/permease subunit
MSAKPARRSGSFKRDKKDPIDVVFEKVPTAEDGRAAAGEKAGSKTTFSSRAQHGIIGKALYLWVTPFLKLGGERTLQMDDLLPLPEGYLASNNSKRFEESLKRALERERDRLRARAEWDGEGKAPKDPFLPAVMWPLWHCFGGIILTGSLFKLLNDLIQFLPAVVLGGFLRFIAGKSHPLELFVAGGSVNGYGAAYCLLLFFIPVLRTVFEQVYFYYAQASGICIKGALGTAVYRKTMRLSAAGRDGSTTGEVLNHMQLDAQRVGDLMLFINVLWSGILQTVGYMTLLYFYIGWASLGGFAVMVILIPLQKAFFQMISKLRREQMKLTDRRVKLQNEALSGVKILKLNAWEEPLRKEVEGVRAEEMRKAKAVQNRNALNAAIMNTGPTLVAVAAFSLYSGAMGREMTPSVIFPSLSLFSLLRFPVMFYPGAWPWSRTRSSR